MPMVLHKQKGRLKSRPPAFDESRSNAQRARLGGGIALGDGATCLLCRGISFFATHQRRGQANAFIVEIK